jgi:hypothetical protein
MNQKNVTTLGIVCLTLSLMSVIVFYILRSQSPSQIKPFQQRTTNVPNTLQDIPIDQSISQEKTSSQRELAEDIAKKCAPQTTYHERKTCFESQILTTINDYPKETDNIFTGLWALAVEGKISDDPRIFIDAAHEAGMMLESAKISLPTAFTYCGTTLKQGCMHGYVMEYIDDTYPKQINPKTLKTICEHIGDPLSKINCIHGLGHGLAAKIQKDLTSVLATCKDIAETPIEFSACESGIFMEYTKGTAGSGRHTHQPIGTISLPCDTLPDQYQRTCIASEGAYRQYNQGHEDFKTTYDYCLSHKQEYIPSCMMAVSERAIMSTAENADKAMALCNQLDQKEQISLCLGSMIKVSKTQFDNKNLTAKLQEFQTQIAN